MEDDNNNNNNSDGGQQRDEDVSRLLETSVEAVRFVFVCVVDLLVDVGGVTPEPDTRCELKPVM